MANLPTTYATGTVTVGAGSTTVTGSGTSFVAAGVEAGDIFWAAGLSVRIAAVNSATSLTLAYPWPGGALSAANYEVRYTPDITRALASARDVLTQLTNGNLSSVAALATAANKLAYYTGQGTAALTDLTPEARTLLGSTALSRSGSTYTLNGLLAGTAVQQSATDNTADRLLKVLAFGLGATTGVSAPNNDANDCVICGLSYRFTTAGVNCPTATPYGGSLQVFTGTGGDIHQLFVDRYGSQMWLRGKNTGTGVWTSWRRVMTEDDLVASGTDGTEGKIVRIGHLGYGPRSIPLSTLGITDFNEAYRAGNYTLSGVTANGPGGNVNATGTLFVMQRAYDAGARVTQIFSETGTASPKIWVRVSTGATIIWQPWVLLFHSGNLVGAVSQSGGQPTGAGMEGPLSNANGEYWRFANGLLICMRSAVQLTQRSAAHLGVDWTFPATFATPPVGTITGPGTTSDYSNVAPEDLGVSLWNGSTGTAAVAGFRKAYGAPNFGVSAQVNNCRLTAIGRWF